MTALPAENVVFLNDSQDAVIDVLTDLLNRAREGEILAVGVAYITMNGCGSSRGGLIETVAEAYGMVGGLEGIKHDILVETERRCEQTRDDVP